MKNFLLILVGFVCCMLLFDVCNIYTPKDKPVITPADTIRKQAVVLKNEYKEKFERSDSARQILEQKNLQLSKQVSSLKERAKNADFTIEVLEMALNDTSLQQPVNPAQQAYILQVKARDSVQKNIIATQDSMLVNKDSIIANRDDRIKDDSAFQAKTENLLDTALANQSKLEKYSLQLEKKMAKKPRRGLLFLTGVAVGFYIKSKIKKP